MILTSKGSCFTLGFEKDVKYDPYSSAFGAGEKMSDDQFEYPKPAIHMDRDSFSILFNLFMKQKWLEKKSSETIELWNECENNNQQDLVVSLLHRFQMLSSSDISDFCNNIAKVICENWHLDKGNTYLVALCNDGKPDGSQYFLQALKSSFVDYNWEELQFINNMKKLQEIPHVDLNNRTIVLLDDFIGTGKTVERRINWLKGRLNKSNLTVDIRLVALASMKEAECKIQGLVNEYYIPILIEKGISDNYPIEKIPEKIAIMKELENKLSDHYNSINLPSLGYGASEALFSIEGGNTPNNVFPIFWWPLDNNFERRRTILKRLM